MKYDRFIIGLCSLFVAFGLIVSVRRNNQNADWTVSRSRKDLGTGETTKQYINFDNWISGKFQAKSVFPKWLSGRAYAMRKNDGSIVKIDIQSKQEELLVESSVWQNLATAFDFSISADQRFAAISYKPKQGYSHYTNTFSIAIVQIPESKQIVAPGLPSDGYQKIKWSPKGQKLAFVHDFDVYVVQNFSKPVIQITSDGKENVQFNGISDWIHELEISVDDALIWWSNTGEYLAYASLNQSKVEDFEFSSFNGEAYPQMISYSYPKPGTPIPTTELHIFNASVYDGESSAVKPTTAVTDWIDYYLNSVLWIDNFIIAPTWKNRFGNESLTERCIFDGEYWRCGHVSAMKDVVSGGWLGHYNPADLVAMTGNYYEYLTILSDNTGFLHLVAVDMDNNTRNWRTSGSFEVTDVNVGDMGIHFYDDSNDLVYFTSTEDPEHENEGLPRIRHLWRVQGHGYNKSRECISCGFNELFPQRCNWVDPSFSPSGEYIVINCGGTSNGVPITTLHRVYGNGTIEMIEVLEDNVELLKQLEYYHIRNAEFGTIVLPDMPEEKFFYALYTPPNFDPSKKYPLLVHVYSGPAYQDVEDKYEFDWTRGYITSSNFNIVTMTFDGRGTGFRGDKIMHSVYRRLGKFEPLDQIEATRQILHKYDFIDRTRIAIWGRSYGGYITARTMAEDSDRIFKCGISVAPVTDWKTYSTLYTEKYMGLPENDNEEGYNISSAIQNMDNYRKHDFYLVHGTSDENVHFLHSARLSKALIDADIDFGAYFAGDEDHQFDRYSNGYGHHYRLLTRHVRECFGLP